MEVRRRTAPARTPTHHRAPAHRRQSLRARHPRCGRLRRAAAAAVQRATECPDGELQGVHLHLRAARRWRGRPHPFESGAAEPRDRQSAQAGALEMPRGAVRRAHGEARSRAPEPHRLQRQLSDGLRRAEPATHGNGPGELCLWPVQGGVAAMGRHARRRGRRRREASGRATLRHVVFAAARRTDPAAEQVEQQRDGGRDALRARCRILPAAARAGAGGRGDQACHASRASARAR